MTPEEYKAERKKRGTQEEVAAELELSRVTIAKRETGAPGYPITREAALAICALPIRRPKPRASGREE